MEALAFTNGVSALALDRSAWALHGSDVSARWSACENAMYGESMGAG